MKDWPINSECPRCGHARLQGQFTRDELIQLLRIGATIEAYCVECDETWDVSVDERTEIARMLNS